METDRIWFKICIYFLSVETDRRYFSRDDCGYMTSVENIFRL